MAAFLFQKCKLCGKEFSPVIHGTFCPHNTKNEIPDIKDKEYTQFKSKEYR